jgi:heme-degrading monooxygenase HmoA
MSHSPPLGDSPFAPRPAPPYFAVVFASLRRAGDHGYAAMAEQMMRLAAQQPGYLGVESARGADGFGLTVSYWATLEAIQAWRRHAEHVVARDGGRRDWYEGYELRVSRVERAYGWRRDEGGSDPAGLAADAPSAATGAAFDGGGAA